LREQEAALNGNNVAGPSNSDATAVPTDSTTLLDGAILPPSEFAEHEPIIPFNFFDENDAFNLSQDFMLDPSLGFSAAAVPMENTLPPTFPIIMTTDATVEQNVEQAEPDCQCVLGQGQVCTCLNQPQPRRVRSGGLLSASSSKVYPIRAKPALKTAQSDSHLRMMSIGGPRTSSRNATVIYDANAPFKIHRPIKNSRPSNLNLGHHKSLDQLYALHQSQNGMSMNHQNQNGISMNHHNQNGTPMNHQNQNGMPMNQQIPNGMPMNHQNQTAMPISYQNQTGMPINYQMQNVMPINYQFQNTMTTEPSNQFESTTQYTFDPQSMPPPSQYTPTYNNNTINPMYINTAMNNPVQTQMSHPITYMDPSQTTFNTSPPSNPSLEQQNAQAIKLQHRGTSVVDWRLYNPTFADGMQMQYNSDESVISTNGQNTPYDVPTRVNSALSYQDPSGFQQNTIYAPTQPDQRQSLPAGFKFSSGQQFVDQSLVQPSMAERKYVDPKELMLDNTVSSARFSEQYTSKNVVQDNNHHDNSTSKVQNEIDVQSTCDQSFSFDDMELRNWLQNAS